MTRRAVIQGIGHSVPEKLLTNAELAKIVDTTDEWITQRTGMKVRRQAEPHESCSTFAIGAAQEALSRSGIAAEELDLILCCTVTGDMAFPSTAAIVQHAIGAKNAAAADLGAACAGFIYGLHVADGLIRGGLQKTVLVIGAEILTKFVDWSDRGTCVLFGDGAGAVILRGEEDSERGLIQTVVFSDGSGARFINMEVGGSLHPAGDPASCAFRPCIHMDGREVYRFAVQAMGDACVKVLEAAGMSAAEVDLFVPHQANLRIIESAAERINLPREKVFVNIENYGNTSAASIPLGLYEAESEGRLKKGDVVLTVGFGAGLVWGANLIRW